MGGILLKRRVRWAAYPWGEARASMMSRRKKRKGNRRHAMLVRDSAQGTINETTSAGAGYDRGCLVSLPRCHFTEHRMNGGIARLALAGWLGAMVALA